MKAVIFDMDGVLFDTERICAESWIAAAEARGLSGMEQIFPRCIGRNAADSRRIVMKAYGEDFDYRTFREETSALFWEHIEKKGLPVMDGVYEILEWMRAEGFQIGLASSTKRESVERCLSQANIRQFFSVVVTGDMVEYSKPKPDIYLLACRKLGTEPQKTYAIEDSPNGIRAAHAAGMLPIMVPDMIEPDAEMRALSVGIYDGLPQVLAFFRETAAETEEKGTV